MKTIGITGGTGLVGKHLTKLLLSKGFNVVIFTRSTSLKKTPDGLSYAHWDAKRRSCDIAAIKRLDAIVHLAGAGIADKRWKPKRKKEITDSRVKGTHFLVSILKEHAPDCKTFVGASATGYYGPSHPRNPPFTETALPYNDFLGNTCVQWEAESQQAADFARTIILRFGIVLGKESGAFAEFARPQSFGIMPILGLGNQVVSWIEVDDLARLILFTIEQEQVAGVYNAVSPGPVSHRQLMKAIATEKGGIKIPVPVPSALLHLLLGEMSTEVLKSCDVSCEKITAAGFTFRHPTIAGAVKAILRPSEAAAIPQ